MKLIRSILGTRQCNPGSSVMNFLMQLFCRICMAARLQSKIYIRSKLDCTCTYIATGQEYYRSFPCEQPSVVRNLMTKTPFLNASWRLSLGIWYRKERLRPLLHTSSYGKESYRTVSAKVNYRIRRKKMCSFWQNILLPFCLPLQQDVTFHLVLCYVFTDRILYPRHW